MAMKMDIRFFFYGFVLIFLTSLKMKQIESLILTQDKKLDNIRGDIDMLSESLMKVSRQVRQIRKQANNKATGFVSSVDIFNQGEDVSRTETSKRESASATPWLQVIEEQHSNCHWDVRVPFILFLYIKINICTNVKNVIFPPSAYRCASYPPEVPAQPHTKKEYWGFVSRGTFVRSFYLARRSPEWIYHLKTSSLFRLFNRRCLSVGIISRCL